MAQSIPYQSYPGAGALGVKNVWAGDHFGPANYQAGYNMTPSQLGMSRIEWADFSWRAQSGNYYARSTYPAISGSAELQAPGFNSVTVKWYYANNNNEVANNANLSAEVAQLFAWGL